jgi:hypothetical protein
MRKDRGQKRHLSRGCPNAIAPPFTLTYIYQIVLILATHLTEGQESNLIPGDKIRTGWYIHMCQDEETHEGIPSFLTL